MSNQNEKKPLRITKSMLERDRAKTEEICEINVSTGNAWIVQKSKAPVLTHDILDDVGSPIQTANIHFEGQVFAIDYFHGVPLQLEIARQNILNAYKVKTKDENTGKEILVNPTDPAVLKQRNDELRHLILSQMICDPVFSYKGTPEDAISPIEDLSDILLQTLAAGQVEVNYPTADAIYQVKVHRHKTEQFYSRLSEIEQKHPLTTEDERDPTTLFVERSDAQRALYVTEMIADPIVSLNADGEGYDMGLLSERMLQCFDAAYNAVHNPAVRRQQVLSN